MNKIDLLNGKYIYYDKGKFDKWCVYEVEENDRKKAPKDIEYFKELKQFSIIFTKEKIYKDFVIIYDLTTNVFDLNVVKKINSISNTYNEYNNQIFRLFSILYMAMIAEENKKGTRLGKRIKRLGIFYLLLKNNDPEFCANFMKGKNWKEIDKLCIEGGF